MKHFAKVEHGAPGEIGPRIYKVVQVRVFNIGNDGFTTRRFKAAAGQGFNDHGIEGLLERIVDDLEKRFPAEDFTVVQVGPASYNFVWKGKRAAPATQEQAGA
jgi:hypothetical protein